MKYLLYVYIYIYIYIILSSVPPLHNLSRIYEENITDNSVKRQRSKTKDSICQELD